MWTLSFTLVLLFTQLNAKKVNHGYYDSSITLHPWSKRLHHHHQQQQQHTSSSDTLSTAATAANQQVHRWIDPCRAKPLPIMLQSDQASRFDPQVDEREILDTIIAASHMARHSGEKTKKKFVSFFSTKNYLFHPLMYYTELNIHSIFPKIRCLFNHNLTFSSRGKRTKECQVRVRCFPSCYCHSSCNFLYSLSPKLLREMSHSFIHFLRVSLLVHFVYFLCWWIPLFAPRASILAVSFVLAPDHSSCGILHFSYSIHAQGHTFFHFTRHTHSHIHPH